MKNIFYILITLFLMSSCGPHRMRCGARGICKAPDQSEVKKQNHLKLI
ncbi:hypothetical protein [Flavobacterium sp. XS2P39]